MPTFGLAAPKILLDANAVRDFFRDRDGGPDAARRERLRHRVRELAAIGSLRVLLTQPVLWELVGIVDDAEDGGWQAYETTMRFYAEVAHGWLVRHEYERYELEFRARRRLRDDEVFGVADVGTLLAECLTEDWVERRKRDLATEKMKERSREARKRIDAVGALDSKDPNWRAMFDEHNFGKTVTASVRRELRKFAREKKLDARGAAWPQPRSVPTFWYSESFWVAKARRVFVENSGKQLTSARSLQDIPDLVDATHFRDAAYADVLVTRDRRFAAVARAARVPLIVVDFPGFADEVLRG